MAIKALIFDFDGLIIDTEGPVFQSWQELLVNYGYDMTLADWQICIGTAEGTQTFFDTLDDRLDRPLDLEVEGPPRRQRELDLIANQPVLPGVKAYIQRAVELDLKLAIASSSSCDWVLDHLEQRGLREYFECVLASDDVGITKPDPSLYLNALECLCVRASQAVAFEDSPNGVLAAKKAGLFCVAVPNPITNQLQIEHADLHLASLAEMSLDQLLKIAESEIPRA